MVEDIAKRLADFGFHAPTLSWPVAGTLMIEPTESEIKAELDRFCEAMIAIRAEIAAIAARKTGPGGQSAEARAAHRGRSDGRGVDARLFAGAGGVSAAMGGGSEILAPVKRVDNVYGDRNLVCTCAPLEAYAAAAD